MMWSHYQVSRRIVVPVLFIGCFLLPLVLSESSCVKRSLSCLKTAGKYSKQLLKSIRIEANGKKQRKGFNACTQFNKVKKCFNRLQKSCPNNTDEITSKYGVFNQTLTAYCAQPHSGPAFEEAKKMMDCFSQEYGGTFWQYCEAFGKFNLEQTKGNAHSRMIRCYHIQEEEVCQNKLLSSWCSNETVQLASEILQSQIPKHRLPNNCHNLSQNYTFKAFGYSEGECGPGLDNRLMECEDEHLKSGMLRFHENNDLIALKASSVDKHCREYKKYRKCIRKYKMACPKAVDMMYAYDGVIRTYLHKMHYICTKQPKNYTSVVPCLKKVVENGTVPTRCEPVWNQVSPLIKGVTSRAFYCHRHHNNSKSLHMGLDNLRSCYTSQYNDTCGPVAAQIMDDMTKRAFSDPYYLQYDFLPDCNSPPESLFGMSTSTTTIGPKVTKPGRRTITKGARNTKKSTTPIKEPSAPNIELPTANTPKSAQKSTKIKPYSSANTIYSKYNSIVILIICFIVSR